MKANRVKTNNAIKVQLSSRLHECRLSKGLSQQELAVKSGISLRSVQNYEAGESLPQPAKLRKLCATLEVPVGFLLGEAFPATDEVEAQSGFLSEPKGNVSQPAYLQQAFPRRVPVVSWARAGDGGNYSDLAEQIDERLDTDCTDANAYALIIEGDSMEPEFRPGDRVIFMPNQQAQNGDVVVARVEETGKAYFKLFHQSGRNGELVRLTSYNPAYPPLEFKRSEFRFIHPMHSLIRRRRR